MKPKKSEKADVEKHSLTFRQVGTIVALLFLITAFTYKFAEGDGEALKSKINFDEEEEIADVTKEPPPPPPPPKPPEIQAVEDDVEIEEEQPDLEPVDIDDEFEVNLDEDFGEQFEEEEEKIFMSVEKSPAPKGGMDAFYEWLYDNIKYPEREREMRIEGTVTVQFVVEKDGSLTQIRLYPGTEELNTKGLNEAALNGLRKAAPWNPGMQGGEPVRVRYQIPIKFKLN